MISTTMMTNSQKTCITLREKWSRFSGYLPVNLKTNSKDFVPVFTSITISKYSEYMTGSKPYQARPFQLFTSPEGGSEAQPPKIKVAINRLE